MLKRSIIWGLPKDWDTQQISIAENTLFRLFPPLFPERCREVKPIFIRPYYLVISLPLLLSCLSSSQGRKSFNIENKCHVVRSFLLPYSITFHMLENKHNFSLLETHRNQKLQGTVKTSAMATPAYCYIHHLPALFHYPAADSKQG